jgi:phage-related holin
MDKKFTVFSFATLMSFWGSRPDNIRVMAFMAVLMILADTVSGIITAGLLGKIKSSKMKGQFFAKIGMYTIVVTCFMVLTILCQSWFFVSTAFTCVMIFEAASMLENLVKLESAGYINLEPVANYIRMIGVVFDTGSERQTIVTTASVFPTHPSAEEVVVTTSTVETVKKPDRTPPSMPPTSPSA